MSNTDKVGYKSPPKEGQWKKGQSGNPSGKKKVPPVEVKSLFYWIAAKLQAVIETTQNGETIKMTAAEAIATLISQKIMHAPLKEGIEALKALKMLGVFEQEHSITDQVEEAGSGCYSEEDRRLMKYLIQGPVPSKKL